MILCSNKNSIAQNNINEYSQFECAHSKLVKLPINDNQTTFYEYRDQFSYWYRIESCNDSIIQCKINPINEGDDYTLLVYQYDQMDFCNKVFNDKIKPLKSSELASFSSDSNSNLVQVNLKPKMGDAFYLCVLNVSVSNCGHHLQLKNNHAVFNINAIHVPCKIEDEVEVKPTTQVEQSTITTEHELSVKVTLKDEYQPTKNIEAKLVIIDELTGNAINIDFKNQNTLELSIEKGKAYKVECLALGYKRFDHSIVISDYLNTSNGFDIFLRPLKSGDTFVMNSIYFYPNTYALKSKSKKEIDYLLNYLTNNPDVNIEIAGHTNENNKIRKNRAYKDKGPEWNFEGTSKKLSILRAESIKTQLTEKGIDASRIETKGYGGDKMIIENAKTLEDIEKNVRVEIQIL